jgi:hypothetical protein
MAKVVEAIILISGFGVDEKSAAADLANEMAKAANELRETGVCEGIRFEVMETEQ